MEPATASSAPSQRLRPIRSPSRTPSLPAPRALRYARFLFHGISAPTFLYALYVQLVVLKAPGRTPLPASIKFGGDTLFLTFHGNLHCAWYACLCLLNSFLALSPPRQRRSRSRAARSIERIVHRFTGLIFPLASFVGLGYYLIIHFHPMSRLRAQIVPDHDQKMALLHLNPLVFVVFDSLLKDAELLMRHGMKQRRAVRAIIAYGAIYFAWTAFCVRMNGGFWPYPFQSSFTAMQHAVFLLFVFVISTYLTRAGYRMQGRIDRRRRRRLAALEGRSKNKRS